MIKTILATLNLTFSHLVKKSKRINPRSFLIKLSFLVLLPYSSYSLAATPMVYSGYFHSYSLKTNGTVFAWGDNSNGQLGDGTTTEQHAPVVVKDSGGNPITGIQALYSNVYSTLALKTDGTVLAWGDNIDGQLGDGTQTERHNPVVVKDIGGNPITGIQAIGIGRIHSLALKTDGTLLGWGRSSSGTLGGNLFGLQLNPVVIKDTGGNPITDIQAIAVGTGHSLALKTDGTMIAWGSSQFGQLGDGTTNQSQPNPVVVKDIGGNPITGIQAIATRGGSSFALKTDGTLLAWGYNIQGELGDGTSGTNRLNPVVLVSGGAIA